MSEDTPTPRKSARFSSTNQPARPKTPKQEKTPNPRVTTTNPRGCGRRRKPTAPRNEEQFTLAEEVKSTEAERDAAHKAYKDDTTVAAELRLMRAELALASAWGAYCRAQGNLNQALGYQKAVVQFGRSIAALRELLATDDLAAIKRRRGAEDALSKPRKRLAVVGGDSV